jgi:hypothetical protein
VVRDLKIKQEQFYYWLNREELIFIQVCMPIRMTCATEQNIKRNI